MMDGAAHPRGTGAPSPKQSKAKGGERAIMYTHTDTHIIIYV